MAGEFPVSRATDQNHDELIDFCIQGGGQPNQSAVDFEFIAVLFWVAYRGIGSLAVLTVGIEVTLENTLSCMFVVL
jgi:hypothetical protein